MPLHISATDATLFEYSPLQLLIMQSTPFCNINCKYCYLPARENTARMLPGTVDAVYEDLLTAPFVGNNFTTLWHAGEPLIAGIPFYAEALRSSARLAIRGCKVDHSLQTNGTLINESWCEFFQESSFRIGVSLDGPAEFHDRNRRTRDGRGTFAETMSGVTLLRRYGIEFNVICVLTRYSLDFPDRLFAFFASVGAKQVAFNIDEVDGVNSASSMTSLDSLEAFRRFLQRFYILNSKEEFEVREFGSLRRDIFSGETNRRSVQTLPFGIISVAAEGNYTTFSPELLGMKHPKYGGFYFGNIRDQPFTEMLDSAHFRRVYSEIQSGTQRCRATCQYYGLCGGGSPSNKLFENGAFDSAETMYCKFNKKAVVDVVLREIESDFNLLSPELEITGRSFEVSNEIERTNH